MKNDVGSYKKSKIGTSRVGAFVPDGEAVQGSAPSCLIGTGRIDASVPHDEVVQGSALVPDIGSFTVRGRSGPAGSSRLCLTTVMSCRATWSTNRIGAFVPHDGDVVQGNVVVPEVGSYKRTFWTNRIDEVVQGNVVVPRGEVVQGDVVVEENIERSLNAIKKLANESAVSVKECEGKTVKSLKW